MPPAPSEHPAPDDAVRAAYTAVVDEYVAAIGALSDQDEQDVALILRWGASRAGLVVDAGCGPGHWTHLLAGVGVRIEGVDPVPAFVASAQARFPGTAYRAGAFDDLGVPDGSAAGVLAWYSTIHHDPARLPGVLDALRRTLADDGSLLLGHFRSERLEAFGHRLTTAWSWPEQELVRRVEDAGFVVRESHSRPNPRRPDRWHGALVADAV